MKREFVMLAHKLDTQNMKQHIGNWWYSEKLDGERCFWDGGASRGLKKSNIPFANTAKDERYQSEQIATGLWSRYGNVIHAPDFFLDALPSIPLDGELYSRNPMKRQFIHSTIKKIIPNDTEWLEIVYKVFDSPPPRTIFADGTIDTTNFKKRFVGIMDWYTKDLRWCAKPETRFESTYSMLKEFLDPNNRYVQLHEQWVLPAPQFMALQRLEYALGKILEAGGEGLIVRDPNKTYVCGRVHHMLKYKPFDDAEGRVIGYTTGRETELGSKLLGKMGALILMTDFGTRLELSGFTDSERVFQTPGSKWATENPGIECPDWIQSVQFPRGTRVSFKYRGLSADNVPQEARYWRKRE